MKKKLFKVEMCKFKGVVYVIADNYDDAARKGLLIRKSKEYKGYDHEEVEDISELKVKNVELLTEHLVYDVTATTSARDNFLFSWKDKAYLNN